MDRTHSTTNNLISDILLYFLVLSLLTPSHMAIYNRGHPPPLGVWCFPILYTVKYIYLVILKSSVL